MATCVFVIYMLNIFINRILNIGVEKIWHKTCYSRQNFGKKKFLMNEKSNIGYDTMLKL